MKKNELWKLGILNVCSAPVRSFLTVLGMSIGIAAVMAVLSLGEAGQKQVRSEMGRLGIDKVWITSENSQALRYGDGRYLEDFLSTAAGESTMIFAAVESPEVTKRAPIVGCTEAYIELCNLQIVDGRMPYPYEWSYGGNAVLLGKTLAENLCVGALDQIYIKEVFYTVCGIVDTQDGVNTLNVNEAVFVPIEEVLAATDNRIQEIVVEIPANQKPEEIAELAVHAFALKQKNDLNAITMQVQIDAANSVIDTFVNVLKWVALICILVGGIGIMNILFVSVRERRREVGIMMAIGVDRGEISQLFLLEALLYSILGGIMGTLSGLVLIIAAGRSIGLSPVLKISDSIAVLFSALFIGLFFGLAPIFRVSSLTPVEALRAE